MARQYETEQTQCKQAVNILLTSKYGELVSGYNHIVENETIRDMIIIGFCVKVFCYSQYTTDSCCCLYRYFCQTFYYITLNTFRIQFNLILIQFKGDIIIIT